MMDNKDLIWQELIQLENIPTHILAWLDDHQSLTAKLKKKFPDFSVNVLSQTESIPSNNEADLLNYQGACVVREVELLGNNQAVVFARSVIPITDDTQDLLKIGSKPLGEILFNDTNIKREQLQITHTNNTWGRRSVFTIGHTKLSVSEFFLEVLYA